jgi:hypothetical protein
MKKTGCLTGNVGDCVGRTAAMDARIKSLAEGMKIVGPALTVRAPPTDNLMIHKALTLIKPGDVLVIEGGGNHSWALLGFLMVSTARKLGVAGIVADGCVRDAQEIRKSGFPVFFAGLSPNGPFKEGPGEINYPIRGSTTAILVNIPGESSSVMTCLDGYQMARQGRAGKALGISAIGSFIAGTLSVCLLMLVAPVVARSEDHRFRRALPDGQSEGTAAERRLAARDGRAQDRGMRL